MLILLPPSEGKTGPRRGRPLDLEGLSFPELSEARARVLDALVAVSGGPDALTTLKAGESLADLVHANSMLRSAPCSPASSTYTGVLYEALDFGTLSPSGRRRANASVLIFSALFGVVRPTDRIPAYRLTGSVSLPRVGSLARFWRGELDGVLPAGTPIVDCRSSTYAPFWTPPGAWPVRVFREVRGKRTVVSHMAKHARGLVARALCEAPRAPRTIEQAVAAASDWFGTQAVTTAAGAPVSVRVELAAASLDVITD